MLAVQTSDWRPLFAQFWWVCAEKVLHLFFEAQLEVGLELDSWHFEKRRSGVYHPVGGLLQHQVPSHVLHFGFIHLLNSTDKECVICLDCVISRYLDFNVLGGCFAVQVLSHINRFEWCEIVALVFLRDGGRQLVVAIDLASKPKVVLVLRRLDCRINPHASDFQGFVVFQVQLSFLESDPHVNLSDDLWSFIGLVSFCLIN